LVTSTIYFTPHLQKVVNTLSAVPKPPDLRTTFDIPDFGDTLCQMALQIKCTGSEWKTHVKGNFAALQVGEEILFYDFQHPGDKDFVRKSAEDFRLKFTDRPELNTVSITKES